MTRLTHFFLPLCLSAILLTGCGQKTSNPDAPAEVSYEETDLDIGDVIIEDGIKKLEFIVKNTGGNAFRVTSVSTSCDCTHADYDPNFIYGGKQTAITVTLDPKDLADGAFERLIAVYTDLKQNPDTLSFHGVAKHK